MLNEKQIDAVINLLKVILERQSKYKKMNHKVNKVLHGKNYDIAGDIADTFVPIDGFIESELYETLDVIIADKEFTGIIYCFMELKAMDDTNPIEIESNGKTYYISALEDLEIYLKRNL